MMNPVTAPRSVVFVHGLWVHSDAWDPWLGLFEAAGYAPIAPAWPGEEGSVELTRANPGALAGRGIDEITAHYAQVIDGLPNPPVVIGHSFGGLIAQKLLAQGRAVAAVAIDPGQIKGVKPVPLAQVRAGLPILKRPRNKHRAVALTKRQFRFGFGNALSRDEADELFERWTIPGPGLPLFEASTANFKKVSPAAVDTRKADRGPLLMIAGGKDHTVPLKVVKAAHSLYRNSPATTDLEVFPDRGHSLVFDSKWREIADYTLAWLRRQAV
ncbi:alpha/beta hydrolase [Nocardioides bizhenqiangii]|uniref:Alpha/beta hydrolase n=1 Tax=Nocardioides bizhenqiangii TaxID=3095076 RepID=A0ABZ0ZNZ0_9ACTN|nr:alpha/beta hydrolase [Nocardioides sp. HM61]WQQ25367.1 alpha/beta hydrolase [Nocardioides sp. HM61]